jgi:hypothetical protein
MPKSILTTASGSQTLSAFVVAICENQHKMLGTLPAVIGFDGHKSQQESQWTRRSINWKTPIRLTALLSGAAALSMMPAQPTWLWLEGPPPGCTTLVVNALAQAIARAGNNYCKLGTVFVFRLALSLQSTYVRPNSPAQVVSDLVNYFRYVASHRTRSQSTYQQQ